MSKLLITITILVSLWSCTEKVSNAKYDGIWVKKTNLNSTQKTDGLTSFSALVFDYNRPDSVFFYIKPDSLFGLYGFSKYDIYYLKFGNHNEAYVVYDYKTDEIIFHDIKEKKNIRYQKLDTINNNEIYDKVMPLFK